MQDKANGAPSQAAGRTMSHHSYTGLPAIRSERRNRNRFRDRDVDLERVGNLGIDHGVNDENYRQTDEREQRDPGFEIHPPRRRFAAPDSPHEARENMSKEKAAAE